jgi:argininosuccinate lyase
MKDYTVSIHYDRRLYRQDIAGSIAHARMLGHCGIIANDEAEAIAKGLEEIRAEIEGGSFPWKPELEDIHMNVEARLREKIGPVAGKLHTARSRNDQIALDMRLYTKEAVQQALGGIKGLQRALLDAAEANKDAVMPGYTHVQRAQPVLFAHHMLAYFQMFQRDAERLQDCYKRTDVLPLGSGALAGVPYPIDRESVANELGFSRISENSMDAVSDRDFLVEFHAAAATCMMHLSRMAEEVVLWSSQEFGFVALDDAYVTGSSIMPQKRNPDFAELARGRTGRVYGHLMGLLTMLKGLPLTYNRDLQEDKEGLFDTVDTLLSTLEVFTGMISTMKVDPDRMRRAALESYVLAYALEQGKYLHDLTLEELKRFSPHFEEDVLGISVESSIAARDVPGGTAPGRVEAALEAARKQLEESLEG